MDACFLVPRVDAMFGCLLARLAALADLRPNAAAGWLCARRCDQPAGGHHQAEEPHMPGGSAPFRWNRMQCAQHRLCSPLDSGLQRLHGLMVP